MTSFLRQLFRDKVTAIMLLTSSMIIAICALAPAMFVIIVLNKYLASGVLATLVSLAIGAILLLAFEFAFRQNRAGMIQQSSSGIYSWLPLGKIVLEKITEIFGAVIKSPSLPARQNIIYLFTFPISPDAGPYPLGTPTLVFGTPDLI